MEVKGVLKNISEIQVISEKFKKRSVILQTIEKYPQLLEVNFVNEKVDLLNPYQIDQHVTIGINLRGNVWKKSETETRYFTEINGWRIDESAEEITNGIQNEARQVASTDLPF
tara:strand:+ start:413 stop:751 length:339 start_codon:yes stop_codon:yes gene_type:complete